MPTSGTNIKANSAQLVLGLSLVIVLQNGVLPKIDYFINELLETSIIKKISNTRKVLEIKRGKVDPYTTHSLEGTVIIRPSLAPTMVTTLMNVSYWLKIELELPGSDLEPHILLMVGTVPVQFGPIT